MKILYKPFGDHRRPDRRQLARACSRACGCSSTIPQPPKPTTAEASAGKVVGAAALEAATIAGIAAIVDRYGARVLQHLTGVWPGEQRPDPLEADR